MEHRVIAVVGATGAQGGGLADAILRDAKSGFAVRALTRKPDSEAAKALADRGAEIAQADLDDVESLKRAFDGTWGAFCVTNFWEHFSPEKETQQGKNLAEAAAAAGVKHAIWSTFEDVRDYVPLDDDRMPTLQAKYKVPHFDAKADANHFFTDLGVPTTFFYTSGYYDNTIHFGWGPQRAEDGSLFIVMPTGDVPIPFIAAGDIGPCAYGIFKRTDEYVGKTVGVAGEHLTGGQVAEALTKALGQPIAYNAVPPEVYRGFGFPGADDLGNMFQFKAEFSDLYRGNRSVEESRKLHPGLRTLDAWLTEYGSRIPIPD